MGGKCSPDRALDGAKLKLADGAEKASPSSDHRPRNQSSCNDCKAATVTYQNYFASQTVLLHKLSPSPFLLQQNRTPHPINFARLLLSRKTRPRWTESAKKTSSLHNSQASLRCQHLRYVACKNGWAAPRLPPHKCRVTSVD